MSEKDLSPVKRRFIENVRRFVNQANESDPLFKVVFVMISAAANEGQASPDA